MAPTLNVGLSLGTTIALLLWFDCSTVKGILWYSVSYGMLQYVMWLGYAMLTTLRQDGKPASA